jgi:hypothetical protein
MTSEFFVKDVLQDRSGKPLFVGFPNDGDAVRVGDQFVVRYEVPRTLDDVLNERSKAEPTNVYAISLVVVAIESMRKSIQELPRGVTGALILSGDGMEFLSKNSFLRTAPLGLVK